MRYILDIKGEIEGDYEIIGKYEERPKSKWITNELHNTVCSICGGIRRDNRFDHINFCNKCGADMRVDEEEMS